MGSPLHPSFSFKGEGFVAEMEYAIQLFPDRPLVWRIQDGVRRPTSSYAVVNRRREIVAIPNVDRDWKLLDDVIIFTRLPKLLGVSERILLGGLHGPAIRAIKQLLFDVDVDQLGVLAGAIKAPTEYQAIFRVSGLTIGGSPMTTLPGKVSLDISAPPANITITAVDDPRDKESRVGNT